MKKEQNKKTPQRSGVNCRVENENLSSEKYIAVICCYLSSIRLIHCYCCNWNNNFFLLFFNLSWFNREKKKLLFFIFALLVLYNRPKQREHCLVSISEVKEKKSFIYIIDYRRWQQCLTVTTNHFPKGCIRKKNLKKHKYPFSDFPLSQPHCHPFISFSCLWAICQK